MLNRRGAIWKKKYMKETGELNCTKDLDDFEALELLKKEELIEIILDMEERIECLKKKPKK